MSSEGFCRRVVSLLDASWYAHKGDKICKEAGLEWTASAIAWWSSVA